MKHQTSGAEASSPELPPDPPRSPASTGKVIGFRRIARRAAQAKANSRRVSRHEFSADLTRPARIRFEARPMVSA